MALWLDVAREKLFTPVNLMEMRRQTRFLGMLENSFSSGYPNTVAVTLSPSAGAPPLAVALSREPRQAYLQGLTPGAGAYILARLFQRIQRPILLVTPNVNFHEHFYVNTGGPAFFMPDKVFHLVILARIKKPGATHPARSQTFVLVQAPRIALTTRETTRKARNLIVSFHSD